MLAYRLTRRSFNPRSIRHYASSSSGLRSIRPSSSEIQQRRLTPQHIQFALESLYEDGIVAVENAIRDHDEIDQVSDFFHEVGMKKRS